MISKKFVFPIVLLLISPNLFAQSQDLSYPKGIYLSVEEINAEKPSIVKELKVEKRTIGEIKMSGGNDYRLAPLDKSVSKKEIKKKFLALIYGPRIGTRRSSK